MVIVAMGYEFGEAEPHALWICDRKMIFASGRFFLMIGMSAVTILSCFVPQQSAETDVADHQSR